MKLDPPGVATLEYGSHSIRSLGHLPVYGSRNCAQIVPFSGKTKSFQAHCCASTVLSYQQHVTPGIGEGFPW